MIGENTHVDENGIENNVAYSSARVSDRNCIDALRKESPENVKAGLRNILSRYIIIEMIKLYATKKESFNTKCQYNRAFLFNGRYLSLEESYQ